MSHRTVICVLLALVPLIAGCGLFNDGQESSADTRHGPLDPTNNTLTWPVTPQPWRHGDKLMLRISQ